MNEKNIDFSLPRVFHGNLVFKEWMINNKLSLDDHNIYSPLVSSKNKLPDIVLVPLLAFDLQFNRLGQGGGHYDTYASKHKSAQYIGYSYAEQQVGNIPREKHDITLNKIITNNSVFFNNNI